MAASARFVAHVREAAAAGEAANITGCVSDIYATQEFPTPVRLPQLIALAHARDGRGAILYSLGRGGIRFTAPGAQPAPIDLPNRNTPAGDAVPQLLDAVLSCPEPTLLIVDHASALAPPIPHGSAPTLEQAVILEALQRTVIEPSFAADGKALVLIGRGELNQNLVQASGFRTIRIGLPDADDLERTLLLVKARSEECPDRYAPLEPDLSESAAAALAQGLRNDDIVSISRQAAAQRRRIGPADLKQRKSITIEREARGTLRQMPTDTSLDQVAALAHIKRFIRELLMSGAWPQSILLAGPPGVGKTFVVRAIANELRRHLLMFHTIRSPWVGESEANQATALAVIEDLAPNVVLIDEVDQQLGQQRSGGPSADGGTSERLKGSLWTFTGEGGSTRRYVLFCMTTNRPDLLDAADLSRVAVIPILHPTPSDIVELLPTLAAQLDRVLAPDVELNKMAASDKLRLTSARHLERILGRAATLADLESGRSSPINHKHLAAAIDDYTPHSRPDMEELMALRALELTSFQSLMPWSVPRSSGRPEVPFYVEPLLNGSGVLDDSALQARIAELRARIADRGR